MAKTFLQLNPDKTKVLIIGTGAQREKLNMKQQALNLKPCQQVKNMGLLCEALVLAHVTFYLYEKCYK